MKHKKLCLVLLISALVVCFTAAMSVSACASDYAIDATRLYEGASYGNIVYNSVSFKNVASIEIADSDAEAFDVQTSADDPDTVVLTGLKAGNYIVSVIDTNDGVHQVEIYFRQINIAFAKITGYQREIPFNGKEQPFDLKGEYKGYPATFETEYSDLIGPAERTTFTVKGTGNFTGEQTFNYSITLPEIRFAGITHYKNGFKIDIKPQGSLYRYQLQVRKNGGSWQNYDLKTATSKTLTGLKFKDKYNFRARAYVVVNGKNRFYDGWKYHSFTLLVGLSLNDCKVTGVVNKLYNGKAQTQNIKVTYNGKPVKVKIKYDDNKSVGYHYVKLIGTGDFADSIKVYYHIIPTTPKITGLIERCDKNYAFTSFALKCTEPVGDMSGYKIAYKEKGSNTWQYYDDPFFNKTHIVNGLKEGKIYYVKVRAYKVNGAQGQYSDNRTYSKWSAEERVYLCNKYVVTDYFYCNQNTIKGYATGVFKGEKVQITVDGKTYTVKFTKDAKKYNFKLKIGTHKAGAKIRVRLINKFSQAKIDFYTLTYLSDDIKKGYTGPKVKLVPNFEKPYRTSKEGNNTIWEYIWQTDESNGIYGVLTFKNGKLAKWEYYEIEF